MYISTLTHVQNHILFNLSFNLETLHLLSFQLPLPCKEVLLPLVGPQTHLVVGT